MFLNRLAFQLKNTGPLMKLRDRLPVCPAVFWKNTCPAKAGVLIGLAPRTLVSTNPVGSAWFRSNPCITAPVPKLVAVAKSTLGLIAKTPFGVL